MGWIDLFLQIAQAFVPWMWQEGERLLREDPLPEGPHAIHLDAVGPRKIAVIKAVRALRPLGLREAKDLVESAPCLVTRAPTPEAAQAAVDRLREAGAEAHVLGDEAAPRTTLDAATVRVRVDDAGRRKIPVIKALREHTGLGLAEAKAVAEGRPGFTPPLRQDRALDLLEDLQAAGARAVPVDG